MFQKVDIILDQKTTNVEVPTRDSSGKTIGKVCLPSTLSPFSSRKSAACIVVEIIKELVPKATMVENGRVRLPGKTGKHNSQGI